MTDKLKNPDTEKVATQIDLSRATVDILYPLLDENGDEIGRGEATLNVNGNSTLEDLVRRLVKLAGKID